jgi:hypothetical protein
MKLSLILALFFLSVWSCRKKSDLTEEQKLPAVSETGAHNFGFLLNGMAWTPKGWSLYNPNFDVIVDPSHAQGDVSIKAYRREDGRTAFFTIVSDSIKAVGKYPISDFSRARLIVTYWDETNTICQVDYNGIFARKGYIEITKYDLAKQIISGKFEISFINKNCGWGDTTKITSGRFDASF